MAVLAILALFAAVRSQAAAGAAQQKTAAKDLQALKGPWRMTAKEVDGKKLSDEEIRDVIATFDGSGTCTVRRGDQVIGAGIAKLDPTTKPRMIAIAFTAGEHKGKTVLGIYELEGDTFRVCIGRPGDGRPAAFTAEAGSGRTRVVFQREKK
jgi:uncharacterized protein (TIGR03067 family)